MVNFFVLMRDVRGTPEKFVEAFHDDGQTDMYTCMTAYRHTGFDGLCRPDHAPTMSNEINEQAGYTSIGRLFAIGYLEWSHQTAYSNGVTENRVRSSQSHEKVASYDG